MNRNQPAARRQTRPAPTSGDADGCQRARAEHHRQRHEKRLHSVRPRTAPRDGCRGEKRSLKAPLDEVYQA